MFIFNPATDKYRRIGNLNGGHWLPSDTELGNGNGNVSTVTSHHFYIAPPGWYMLFVVNASGVPSVARWVHVSDVAANR